MLRNRPVLGCLAGVLIGTAGVGAQLGIETNAGVWIGTFPFAYAAALLSTIVGDLNGGIASLLVGGIGIWYFLIEPHYSFNIRISTDEIGLLLYFGIGLLIVASTHLMLGAMAESAAAADREKLLLRELQHRVKNHVQLVGALLGVHARMSGSEDVRDELLEARGRMNVVAKAYSNVYAFGTRIDIRQHLQGLCASLATLSAQNVRIELDAVSEEWDLDQVMPVSLILNELITNAIKYGGRRDDPLIRVSLERNPPGMWRLTVADSGPGLPEGFDLDRQTTVGLSTVRLLAKNLGGSVTARNEHGAVFSVQFPA